ncbi:MAG: M20 family metallopeptidase, partial [Promethearchaeota archaeon]
GKNQDSAEREKMSNRSKEENELKEKEIKPKEPLTEDEKNLLKIIDDNRDKLVELCQSLVRIDSRTYDPSIYSDLSEIFDFVKGYMEREGFKTETFYCPTRDPHDNPDNKWINMIAYFDDYENGASPGSSAGVNEAGIKKGKSLQFQGHLDIVPFTEEKWTSGIPPLSGLIKDGKIYGRGAVDMKGGVAAMMIAMIALKKAKVPLNGRLQMWFVPDEEIDAYYGARFMVKNHFDKINTDATIIGEPTGQSPVKAPVIVNGEKGINWFKLRFFGAAGHGSMPKEKSNSLNKAVRFMSNIKKWPLPKVKPPLTMMDAIKVILSRYSIGQLLKILKAANGEEPNPYDEDGVNLGAFFKTTVSFNIIKAGNKINVIPDICDLGIDMRTLPGINTQDLITSIVNYAAKLNYRVKVPEGYINPLENDKKISKRPIDIEIEIISSHEGSYVSTDTEFFKTLSNSFEAVFRRRSAYFFAPGGSDAAHLRSAGVKNVLLFGPGGGNAHSANEFVNIDQLINCAKTYLLTAYRWLK